MARWNQQTGERETYYRGRPLTAAEAEEQIQLMMDLLEDTVETFETVAIDSAKAEAAYRTCYARAFLESSRKTDTQRREEAVLRSSTQLQDRLIKSAIESSTAEACRMRRSELDALRSINSNARAAQEGRGN